MAAEKTVPCILSFAKGLSEWSPGLLQKSNANSPVRSKNINAGDTINLWRNKPNINHGNTLHFKTGLIYSDYLFNPHNLNKLERNFSISLNNVDAVQILKFFCGNISDFFRIKEK